MMTRKVIRRQNLTETLSDVQQGKNSPSTEVLLKYPSLWISGSINRDGIAAVQLAETMLADPALVRYGGAVLLVGSLQVRLKIEDWALWLWKKFRELKRASLAVDKFEALISRN